MEPIFILIQHGEIIDVAGSPTALLFSAIDALEGFQVAVGCVNEYCQREIVGLVADVAPVGDCAHWYVSSEQDNGASPIGTWGHPESLVRVRLATQLRAGRFDDLANLPPPVCIAPAREVYA